jgi:hypothetical protein
LMDEHNSSKKYIIVGMSEYEDLKSGIYNADLLSTGYILDAPNTHAIIAPRNVHITYGLLKIESLLKVIQENYDVLSTDMKRGAAILNTQLEYNEKSR